MENIGKSRDLNREAAHVLRKHRDSRPALIPQDLSELMVLYRR